MAEHIPLPQSLDAVLFGLSTRPYPDPREDNPFRGYTVAECLSEILDHMKQNGLRYARISVGDMGGWTCTEEAQLLFQLAERARTFFHDHTFPNPEIEAEADLANACLHIRRYGDDACL